MENKIEHEGVIIGLNSETMNIQIKQNSACSECHAKKACMAADTKEKIIEIPRISGKYKEGDQVTIVGKTSMGMMAVFYAFIIPLTLIVLALGISVQVAFSEGIAALIALAVLSIYYVLLYCLKDKLKQKFTFSIK